MNYIKKVAELLNVEVGEHFTIHFKKEKRQIKNFYLRRENVLVRERSSDGNIPGHPCGSRRIICGERVKS